MKVAYRLILLLNLILMVTLGSWTLCLPANALLRQHHETPNVLRYHAQDSLKDRDGNTWQVLLFPENYDSKTNYYLRLVGFPGVNTFLHPQSLEILTAQGQILTATDVFQQSTPAPNVGQYNFTPIISQLTNQNNLKLAIPLLANRELSLKIPHEVVKEWQLLTQEIESKQ
ncbi:MAG: DUF3122 domain-containing protein [Waterburya sp.]